MAETGLVLSKEDAFNNVMAKIAALEKNNGIKLPKNYSAENAINSAWLMLQEVVDKEKTPALDVCTKTSIVESLYNMVLQGLSPAKKQCYFVVYGNKLVLMKSYMGTIVATKRINGVKDIKAFVIYEGDTFETIFNSDTYTIEFNYQPKFENINSNKIKGAFALIIGEDNKLLHTEVMTIEQIRKSWGMGTAYKSGRSSTHNDFAEEMAKKSVINRACKRFYNTSDDSDVLIESLNNTDEDYDDSDIIENTKAQVHEEIKANANQEVIDIDPKQVTEVNENPIKNPIPKEPSENKTEKAEQQVMCEF
ncbi:MULTISPECIES: RecT family recombinase [unclassified Clostridium]|uniref:RecT family recombinase n=1 Tax=unclassified Clostridium TaxID=2614128 RepID=UPI0002982470|nr:MULTISPECIES: RecT family recombinase [unclassified Clostridium]EKQ52416.1 MAG: recombinational DNA repair protein (RecE pathway) [Clostridium sp. Maddingley MBC34-26]